MLNRFMAYLLVEDAGAKSIKMSNLFLLSKVCHCSLTPLSNSLQYRQFLTQPRLSNSLMRLGRFLPLLSFSCNCFSVAL